MVKDLNKSPNPQSPQKPGGAAPPRQNDPLLRDYIQKGLNPYKKGETK